MFETTISSPVQNNTTNEGHALNMASLKCTTVLELPDAPKDALSHTTRMGCDAVPQLDAVVQKNDLGISLQSTSPKTCTICPVHMEPSRTEDIEYNSNIYKYDNIKNMLIKKQAVDTPFSKSPIQYKSSAYSLIPSSQLIQSCENDIVFTENGTIDATSVLPDDEVPAKTRVGTSFQCDILPQPQRMANYTSSFNQECLWDPVKANTAIQEGEYIDAFMSTGGLLTDQIRKMEALHAADYKVDHAQMQLQSMKDGSYQNLSNDDINKFLKLIMKESKQKDSKRFNVMAKKLGCSPQTVMVHYYRWKRSCSLAYPVSYDVFKESHSYQSSDPDQCAVCGDGGELILCDNCNQAYHWKICLPQPLVNIPVHENWYCHICINSSTVRLWSLWSKRPHLLLSPHTPPESLMQHAHLRKYHLELPKSKLIENSPARSKEVIHTIDDHKMFDAVQGGLQQPPLNVSTNTSSQKPLSNTIPLPNNHYTVDLPLTENGFLIQITKHASGVGCCFTGYRKHPDGRAGPAEVHNIFQNIGDQIIQIADMECATKPFITIVEKIKDISNQSSPNFILHLKMQLTENANHIDQDF